jgi:alpha-1,3-rhamnosyl/mannosyltransferase
VIWTENGIEKESLRMRVVLNQLPTAGKKTGVGHYTEQLIYHLRELNGRHQIDCFPRSWIHQASSLFAHGRQLLEKRGEKPVMSLKQWVLLRLRDCARAMVRTDFRSLCGSRRYDLYHEPNFVPLPSDLPTVATIHDLSALLRPEWHPLDRVKHFERNFLRSLRRCHHFFAISESCRQEIIQHLGIPPERITRTYMGVREDLRPLPAEKFLPLLRRLQLPPKYLLCLGTIEPRKNLMMLMKAYCSMPRQLREEWPLLLVGNWGWKSEELAEFYQTHARHQGVIWRAYLPDGALAATYCGARALLFPSLYEGFGMPPLEMVACGGAVLSSTAAALRETVGRQAHLIDPNDISGWRDAIQRVVSDRDWWLRLRAGGVDTAKPYTWARCAAETMRAYHKIAGHSDESADVTDSIAHPLQPAA